MGHELSDIFVGSSLFGLGGRGTMRLIFVLTPAFKPPGLFHSFIHSFTKLALAHRKSTASGTNAASSIFPLWRYCFFPPALPTSDPLSSDAHNEVQWALTPSLFQHFGVVSTKLKDNGVRKNAKSIWNLFFWAEWLGCVAVGAWDGYRDWEERIKI